MSNPIKSYCHVCGQLVTLTRGGRYRVHYPLKSEDAFGGNPAFYCSGSGQFAADHYITVTTDE